MSGKLKIYKTTTERWLIGSLKSTLDSWIFFKPFSTAETLEQYYLRGYWYGFFFLIFVGILFLALDRSGLYLGFLTNRASDLPEGIKFIFKGVTEFFGVKTEAMRSFSSFPVYFLIPIFYLLFNFIPAAKRKIGEMFSYLFISGFSKSIDLGEWFIKSRWISIGTILALTFFITLGLYYLVAEWSNKKQLKNELNNWFVQTEKFIQTTTLSRNQYEEYERNIKPYWNDKFKNAFSTPENKVSSFAILNTLLNQLYGKPNLNTEWFAHLRSINLDEITNNKPGENLSEEEQRGWCMVYILAGRIHNRRFQKELKDTLIAANLKSPKVNVEPSSDTESKSDVSNTNTALQNNSAASNNAKARTNTATNTSVAPYGNGNTALQNNSAKSVTANANTNEFTNSATNTSATPTSDKPSSETNLLEILANAEDSFKAAQTQLDKAKKQIQQKNIYIVSADEDERAVLAKNIEEQETWTKNYQSAINNGLGNIYSNTFLYLVGKKRFNEPVTEKKIFEGCKYARDCASEAKEHFIKSSEGFEPCSFQAVRKTNNIADLYFRISQNYKIYAETISSDKYKEEMSKSQLASNLDAEVLNLTKCLKEAPKLILATMAQASAESAELKLSQNKDEDVLAQVKMSANYLKMAYNFDDPSILLSTELTPFCKFIENSQTSLKMSDADQAVYKKYQEAFKNTIGEPSPGGLDSPMKQINRLIGEVCQ